MVQVGIAFDNFLVMHHAFGRRLVQLLCIEEAKLQTRKCSTDRLGTGKTAAASHIGSMSRLRCAVDSNIIVMFLPTACRSLLMLPDVPVSCLSQPASLQATKRRKAP